MDALNLFRNRIRRFLPPVARFWPMPPWSERAMWFAFGFVAAFLVLFARAIVISASSGNVWVQVLP
jgi:hypothetical protein